MSAPCASTLIGGCSVLIGALLHTASTVASPKGLPAPSVFGCFIILLSGPSVDRVPARGCCGASADVHPSFQNVTSMLTAWTFEPRGGDSVQKNRPLRVITDGFACPRSEERRVGKECR